MKPKQAVLTLSLDFELHWGRFDRSPVEGNEDYYLKTREAIPALLRLFSDYKVEATWATVGMLFGNGYREWKHYSPREKPGYLQPKYSAYEWAKSAKHLEPLLFAPDLIEKIIQTPGQELGSHTFSHYYTLAAGQTGQHFRQDLQAAQRIAKEKFGLTLTSLVFPRNQFNPSYLKICREEGFLAVRSNPADWYWRDTSREWLIKRILRTGDALLPIGKKSSYALSDIRQEQGSPILLPASRFLRPHQDHFPFINRWKLERVKNELATAAREGSVYHLWWHPHNHGTNPEESLECLKHILEHFQMLRRQYGMISKNMKNLAEMVSARSQCHKTPARGLDHEI